MAIKVSDLAKQYGVDRRELEAFLKRPEFDAYVKRGIGASVLNDGTDPQKVMDAFYRNQQLEREQVIREQEQARLAQERALEAARNKQIALANMLITSGFSFDGYRIVKYSGYISGDDAIEVPRGRQGLLFNTTTKVSDALMSSLVQIRRQALAELKEAAYDLGCNAVIGVDFDYITLDPETVNANGGTLYLPYVFGVTANGNAVVIEKIEE